MGKQPKGTFPREDFFAWLREGQEPLQIMEKDNCCTTFVKFPHGENVTYLFSSTQYTGKNINWDAAFEFCGMYFPDTQALRLAGLNLIWAVDALETEEIQRVEQWYRSISQSVNERIEQKIANDRNNLSIRELSEPKHIRRFWDFEEYKAWAQAEDIFFRGEAPDTEYHSSYYLQEFPKDYRENAVITYFQDADSFLEEEAKKYIDTHEEEILLAFLENDLLLEKYEALEQRTGNDFSRQRQITMAIRTAGAKTVSVTVEREGETLTFRANAKDIACGKYSPYTVISESDRQKFEVLFGRHAEFGVENITRIKHGRNVLYEAPQDQTEGIDFTMTMIRKNPVKIKNRYAGRDGKVQRK